MAIAIRLVRFKHKFRCYFQDGKRAIEAEETVDSDDTAIASC